MKIKNKKIVWIIAGIVLVMILFGQIPSKESKKISGESASRSFISSTLYVNQPTTVSIAVNPGTSTYYVINEIVPSGFTITSASDSGDYTTTAGHIFWYVLSGATSKTYTYTVNPGTGTGTKTFIGTIGFESKPEGSIGGTSSVQVSSACTPNWQCTLWSPSTCPSSCSQTRICTDSNNCGTTTGKPAESQACTGGQCGASPTTVTRSLGSPVAKNTDFIVSLATDVKTGDTYYVIDEKYPTQMTVSSASNGGDYTTTPHHIWWYVLSGAQDITYTYTLNSGSQEGTFSFTGTYGSELTQETSILGTNSVTVSTSAFSCTGSTFTNAQLCTDDNIGLATNTPYTLVVTCGTPKCEYTCTGSYYKSGNTCVLGSCNTNADCVSYTSTCMDASCVTSTHTCSTTPINLGGACTLTGGGSGKCDSNGVCSSYVPPTYICTQLGGSCKSQSCASLNMTSITTHSDTSTCPICCKSTSTGGSEPGLGSMVYIFFGIMILMVVFKMMKN